MYAVPAAPFQSAVVRGKRVQVRTKYAIEEIDLVPPVFVRSALALREEEALSRVETAAAV
jgi:hypothetical protein